jgi:hypothetical protein
MANGPIYPEKIKYYMNKLEKAGYEYRHDRDITSDDVLVITVTYTRSDTNDFSEIIIHVYYTRKVNRCYLTCSLRNPQTNIWHSACSFDDDRNAYRFNGLHTSTLTRILCNGKNNDQILMELNKVELKSALEKLDG